MGPAPVLRGWGAAPVPAGPGRAGERYPPAGDRQLWAASGYHVIAPNVLMMGELLCDALELRAGQDVVDVASGTGNTALAAARRRCNVVAVDFVPPLLARAQVRAGTDGLEICVVAGDAHDLPFPDGSFDVVTSTLGVMFATDHERAAAELVRVCRPGGRIGLASWTPDGLAARLSGVVSRYAQRVRRRPPPFRWGSEEAVTALLGFDVELVHSQVRSCSSRYRSIEESMESIAQLWGRSSLVLAHLDDNARQSLKAEIEDVLVTSNCSRDSTILVPETYLEVVGVKR